MHTNEREFETGRNAKFVPRADILEKDGQVTIVAELPGADENSVTVELKDDLLSISAAVHKNTAGESYRLAHAEYDAGEHDKYERSFVLPDDIDRDAIRASVKNGLLRLTLPRVKKPGPRKIEITTQ